MFRAKTVTWSIVEIDYLKLHRNDMPIDQLTIALSKSRNAIKKKLAELDGKIIDTRKKNKRSFIGKRADLKCFFRSGWEANCARWFIYSGEGWNKWQYEPKVFSFLEHGIKHGTVSYCPDFKVRDLWIEVKGMLDFKSKTAIRRFKKFYPNEFKNLQAIVGRPGTKADKFFKEMGVPILAYYSDLMKAYKDKIPYWE